MSNLMKKLALLLAVFLVCPGWQIQTVGTPYTSGPGDVQAFTAWYGLRAYTAAIAAAGNRVAIRIRNTSSNELCDVLIAVNGRLGLTTNCTSTGAGQTVSSFCGGVDCGVHTWYDQVQGNACSAATCNFVQTTNANQPLLYVTDTYTSIRLTANTMGLATVNNFTPAAAKQTLMVVGYRESAGGSAFSNLINSFGSNNRINTANGLPNNWQIAGGVSGTLNVTANTNLWHAVVGVINGTGASGGCVDAGCSPTSNAVASTVAAIPFSFGAANAVRERELGVIDNFAANSTVNGNLITNSKNFWGF
jgi:hypothetical protein